MNTSFSKIYQKVYGQGAQPWKLKQRKMFESHSGNKKMKK